MLVDLRIEHALYEGEILLVKATRKTKMELTEGQSQLFVSSTTVYDEEIV